LADPLIDLRLFRVPAFSASLITNLLGGFVAFGAFLFIGQYLQLVHGLSPLKAGLWTLPSTGGFIAGSMLAPLLVRRARPAHIVAAGLVLAAAGFGILSQVDRSGGLAFLVIGSSVFALGLAPVFTLTTDLILGSAPPERAGSASAISETNAELGGALGIAILGSAGTAIYRTQVADTVPSGVPPEAARAAQDTLGGAVAAAETLPDPLGTALLDASREAFVQALQATSSIAAVVMAGAAVLAVLLLGRRGGGAAQTDQPTLEAANQPATSGRLPDMPNATPAD
jgi:DHA2 family multidrug resistance protein-like MFS transporter